MKRIIGSTLWLAFLLLHVLPAVGQARIAKNHNETWLD